MAPRKPVIGIPADRRIMGLHYFHCVGEKYIRAVIDGADAIPLLIPSLGGAVDQQEWLSRIDGLLLTGSPSNVEPHRYNGPPSVPGTWHDPDRDETTLPLIPRTVASGVPLLAICRGFQEMNVAYGGTLWQRLHEVTGLADHREKDGSLEEQYGPAHPVNLTPGGLLERLAGTSTIQVNSLHSQGVQTLASNLEVEARAPDGVIEAFRIRDAASFAVAVQWHPEWKLTTNPFSRALFAAFGAAARERTQRQSL
jgi:putative glutamine amidotransferase